MNDMGSVQLVNDMGSIQLINTMGSVALNFNPFMNICKRKIMSIHMSIIHRAK